MAKNKKKGSALKFIFFTIVIIAVFVGIAFGAIYILKDDGKKKTKPVENVHTNEKTIDAYGIFADDNDTELYKKEFEALKTNLTGEKIDYDEYAKSVAKMFIIDLYTIKNKANKYDVGGVDFILPSALDNYKLKVEDTIYKYVKDNSDGKRIQNLPVVSSVTITKTDKTKFEIKGDKKYDAYKFTMTWTYNNDYGYDKKGEVIVINKDNKMYVVEKN